MSKTFKACTVFFITTFWLVILRMLFSVVYISDNASSWLFSFLMQVVGMGLIPIVLFKFWVKDSPVSAFMIKTKIHPAIYLIAVVIGFLTVYLTKGISVIWQSVLRLLGYTHVNSVGTIYSGPEVLIMELITVALLPAIFEEITDRGLAVYMFKGLNDDKLTIICVAILFGLCHQNVVQTGYAIAGGFIMAYLAVRTGSIIPGMIIHFINNMMSVFSGYSEQHNGIYSKFLDLEYDFISNNFFLAILTWIAAGVAIFFLLRLAKKIAKPQLDKQNNNEETENVKIQNPISGEYVYAETPDRLARIFDTDGYLDSLAVKQAPSWYQFSMLVAAIALTAATTVMTFLWGLQR